MSSSIQRQRSNNNRRPNQMHNNRGSYSNSNSHRREFSEFDAPQSSGGRSVYDDPRTAAVYCSVLGAYSTVKTKNGSKYKGHTTGFSERGDIAMADSKLETEASPVEEHVSGIIIPKENFVVCITNGVDIKSLSIGLSEFTDAGIAARVNGNSQGPMKELQPWQDDDSITTSLALDDDHTGGWEPSAMFQENKVKFNLESSYHDDLREYTTDLPDPTSAGYTELQRYAKMKADEIERSDIYRSRIAKENDEGDEEAKYSSVQRDKESNSKKNNDCNSDGVRPYVSPALRGADGDHSLRNGNQSRHGHPNMHRQNSPNFHQGAPNSRLSGNNHYSQGPPLPQRPPRIIHNQPPNHASHPHSMPPSHNTQYPHSSSQPSRPPVASHSQSSKPSISNVSSSSQIIAPKISHPQQTLPPEAKNSHLPSTQQPLPNTRIPISQPHLNGDGSHSSFVSKSEQYAVSSNQPSAPSSVATKSNDTVVNVNSMDQKSVGNTASTSPASPRGTTSPPIMGEKRNPRDQEENRKNKVQQLKDFSNNFFLNDSSKSQESSESTEDSSNKSASVSSAIATSESSTNNPEPTDSPSSAGTEHQSMGTTDPPSEIAEAEEDSPKSTLSTLNPLAAEFKPKAPTPAEVQPSPSPVRVSPQVVSPAYAPTHNMTWAIPYHANRAPKNVLPVARGDITAQVTGQPLLAHQPMIYMHGGQSYQVYTNNARMVAPNSFSAAQAGQQGGLDQSSPQPPQVFAMPAHLTHLPQPAHAQAMANTGPQPQPAHIPNPSPSPVQHHQQQHPHHHQPQQSQAHQGQPMPHHMPQAPPQSVTPQPAHYPHVNLQSNVQNMPRHSVAQHQHHMGGPGHPSVSYPLPQYSYPSASSGQSSFVQTPQPQMSQSSNHHGPGHQPQYVVMPPPQGHNTMQSINGQPYSTAGMQFQPQPNLLQGPPHQMPPNHGPNPNQGGNFIHQTVQSMPAGLQQVPGGPNVLMQMQYQPQQ